LIDLTQVPRTGFFPCLETNLRGLAGPVKVYAHFLGAVRLFLGAEAAWIYRPRPGKGMPQGRLAEGDEALCDWSLTRAFVEQRKPAIPNTVLLSPLRVHGRLWAVVGCAQQPGEFGPGSAHQLNRLCRVLGRELARREDERTTRVLDRIKGKVVAELRPRDLAYQILDGLYELVRYDHSAALLTHDREAGVLRVEAEKIVWTKTQSVYIGHEIAMEPRFLDQLREATVHVLPGAPGDGSGKPDMLFDRLLNYDRGQGIPDISSLLAQPLFFGEEFLGVLKIANWKRPPFTRRAREVVERFLPAAAVSLRNVRFRQTLENQAIQAERRASVVTLARAVSHDVNNAMGSILPLAGQVRDDLREGRIDTEALASDLDVIIEKARLCKRIFAKMLRLAPERTGSGPVDVNQVVAEMLPLIETQLQSGPIRLDLALDPALPVVLFSRQHLEHILWNLVTNAIEALCEGGGRIEISTRVSDDTVLLTVGDDGPGIEPSILNKVEEPFFTTKPNGTGLGLSICRSLAWQYGGSLRIESTVGQGTRIHVVLPVTLTTEEETERV